MRIIELGNTREYANWLMYPVRLIRFYSEPGCEGYETMPLDEFTSIVLSVIRNRKA